jgi:hypothetical protein
LDGGLESGGWVGASGRPLEPGIRGLAGPFFRTL